MLSPVNLGDFTKEVGGLRPVFEQPLVNLKGLLLQARRGEVLGRESLRGL